VEQGGGTEVIETTFKGWNGQPLRARVWWNMHIVHVLDLGDPGAPSVTNSIESIQKDVLKTLGLKGKPKDHRWWLYGTDGVITEFDITKEASNRFLFVSEQRREEA
jgi:hypothetical protein